MRVESSQLIPGCVLLKDVIGKTNNPIVPEQTVLTDEHITILHKFLVEMVDVSPKLAGGEPFRPELTDRKQDVPGQTSGGTFAAHYQNTVADYKQLFEKWQNGAVIDIPEVRQILIPFFENVETVGLPVYTLNQYAAEKNTCDRSVSVGALAAFLAQRLGYEKGEWLQIGLAGSLSDCSMAKWDDTLVTKNGSLSFLQWEMIKKHPIRSYRMIEKAPAISQAAKLAVLQHHERLDGSGYPFGLTSEKIHTYSRIIAVCDMYYSLMFERKQSAFDVIGKLKDEQFTTFDQHVLKAFITSFAIVSVNTKVRLSINRTGEIVFMDEQHPAHPIVKLDDSHDILPLRNHRDVHIEAILHH
ncbi:HD-GYP domain-containing protein [Lentibacillus salicampi]|uniref:HD-GYP domain-containing protein n=1 Tax=Lentibacillus salicampi TaxID=175306 RepID=A0A4Y9AAE3_9BACI|nr:HD domain-containing phosphohydrolase [Lentibacillus salicampi]TFJ92302.1 HD-GYP domain-containing protein [Lentibacillus salicampi]